MRTAIVNRPIDACAILNEVAHHRNGATVLFVGTVREENDGEAVSGLDYTAYAGMAERELASIASEAAERCDTSDIVVEHRIGSLELGEASVAIAIASPHRGKAYEASRYVIEELKKRLPVWKREHYVDGHAKWVHAGSGKSEAGSDEPAGAER
jgi:molybdopterin synthase catalytic subunit